MMRMACQAKRLFADFLAEELLFLPFALLHRGIGRREVPRQRKDQADCELRDADTVGAGGVHHDNAAPAGGGDVHVVDARPRARNRAKLRSCGDEGGGDLCGAADDDGICVGEVGGKLFGRPAGPGIDGPSFSAQDVQRGCRKVVGDYDFQCWNPR